MWLGAAFAVPTSIRQASCHSRLGPALAQYGAKWNPSWVSAGSNGHSKLKAQRCSLPLRHELMAKRVERHTQTWEEKMASASERQSVVRAACPHDCPDTCAMLVTVEDGRAVSVRGDPDHPFTRGGLCVKVNNYEQRVYSPDRVLHPLMRSGSKGSGKFERISWDEAVRIIRDRWTVLGGGAFSRGSRRHGPTRLNAMENSTNDAFAPEPDLLQMFALTPTGHVICRCLRCPHI